MEDIEKAIVIKESPLQSAIQGLAQHISEIVLSDNPQRFAIAARLCNQGNGLMMELRADSVDAWEAEEFNACGPNMGYGLGGAYQMPAPLPGRGQRRNLYDGTANQQELMTTLLPFVTALHDRNKEDESERRRTSRRNEIDDLMKLSEQLSKRGEDNSAIEKRIKDLLDKQKADLEPAKEDENNGA